VPDPRDHPDPAALDVVRRFIMGFRTTQLVHVAARLGIADLLADGAKDAPTLAAAVRAHPQALYRLLRALSSLGIFAETKDGRFELTPLADTLRRGVPRSLRDVALLYGDEWLWRAYGRLSHSVMTGQPAFDDAHGQTFYEYLHDFPDAASAFNRAMTAFSEQEAAAILAAYDFSSASTLVDIGAGQGALLIAILRAYPHAHGVLFDQDGVADHARHALVQAGLADRCDIAAGSFFEAVPAGGDVYLLKSVLHNWDDAACLTILRNCHAVAHRGSRLLIVERIIPQGNEPSEAKLFDINMLVVPGGLERTAAEYRQLLGEAGFDLIRVIPTKAPVSIIEGAPAAAPM